MASLHTQDGGRKINTVNISSSKKEEKIIIHYNHQKEI